MWAHATNVGSFMHHFGAPKQKWRERNFSLSAFGSEMKTCNDIKENRLFLFFYFTNRRTKFLASIVCLYSDKLELIAASKNENLGEPTVSKPSGSKGTQKGE